MEKAGHDKVVRDWVGAALSLLPLLRKHPELPMASALLGAEAGGGAGRAGAMAGAGVGAGAVVAVETNGGGGGSGGLTGAAAGLRGGGAGSGVSVGARLEVAAAGGTVQARPRGGGDLTLSAADEAGDGFTAEGGGGAVPAVGDTFITTAGLAGSGGARAGNPAVLGAELLGCVGFALFLYCCVVPRYQRAVFIQKVKQGAKGKAKPHQKLSV